MRKLILLPILLMAAPSSNLDDRLAKWRPVKMPYQSAGLTARERQLVDKLVEASRHMESIYWRQSDPEGLKLLKSLEASKDERDRKLRRLLTIMGSRFDLLDHNAPFVGNDPMSPGRGLYPPGVTREVIEDYVKKRPESREALYSPYSVIRRRGDELVAVPYREEYKQFLEPAARAIREAAALTDDKPFARFLGMLAEALLRDDYYESDLAWLDLVDPKFDVVFGPYETYLDEVLGVKTAYEGAVLIRNDAESRKLAVYQKYVPDIQDALPLAPEDRPSKRGHSSPMEVVDAPFRAGDLRHGYQPVAVNLPNDPKIHALKGTKKIFYRNFMDARVNHVVLPIAKRLMRPEQAARVSGEGYMAGVLLHEIAHGLGPAFARKDGKQIDIREAIGPLYSGLEEAKADVAGMFGLKWLADHGVFPKERLDDFYAAYLAGMFRTLRFGTAEAHGLAELMEFNFYTEAKAVVRDPASGRYAVDFARMPDAIARLAKELLEIEATGDAARAEKWFAKYRKVPPDLEAALKSIRDVPVDIDPIFEIKERVE